LVSRQAQAPLQLSSGVLISHSLASAHCGGGVQAHTQRNSFEHSALPSQDPEAGAAQSAGSEQAGGTVTSNDSISVPSAWYEVISKLSPFTITRWKL
jgi:hypothetical protein